jgi:pimeloyl-ACP methyl ester carboxylesterase
MYRKLATQNLSRLVGAALFSLTLALPAAVSAQQAQPAIGPKQLGAWTIQGMKTGNGFICTASRVVPNGAAGNDLSFFVRRFGDDYSIALVGKDWNMKPKSAFAVELTAGTAAEIAAGTAFRNDGFGVAGTSKVVIIELGGDRNVLLRIARAHILRLKVGQLTFAVPVNGLDSVTAELDHCYGALTHTNLNGAPAPSPTPVSPGNTEVAPQLAQNASRTEHGLIEERTKLLVKDHGRPYALDSMIVRPAEATGRLPIVLLTHGKDSKATDNQKITPDVLARQARDFAARGWLAVVVIRRGYGSSDGLPGVSRGVAFMECGSDQLARGFDVEADDLEGALNVIAARPDADPSRVLLFAQSFGGPTALAFAARQPKGLVGVVNVSGGVRRLGCPWDELEHAMTQFGARIRVPTLWLYAENDTLFAPDLARRLQSAFVQAGGRADLKVFGPIPGEGHGLYASFNGRVQWLREFDKFLLANRLTNTNVARVEQILQATRLSDKSRKAVEEYLAAPLPKAYVFTPSGQPGSWSADTKGVDVARDNALAACRKGVNAECTVTLLNNTLVRPVVTGANRSSAAAN